MKYSLLFLIMIIGHVAANLKLQGQVEVGPRTLDFVKEIIKMQTNALKRKLAEKDQYKTNDYSKNKYSEGNYKIVPGESLDMGEQTKMSEYIDSQLASLTGIAKKHQKKSRYEKLNNIAL